MSARSRWTWWIVFAACALAVMLALGRMTVQMIRLEQAEVAARAEADHQERLRLALWRMESWLAPLLAREAARPYFDYVALYSPENVYARRLGRLESGEVLTPSPLLTFRSEYVPLHFQMTSDGTLTSPQVPTGRLQTLAREMVPRSTEFPDRTPMLERVGALVSVDELSECVEQAEAANTDDALLAANTPPLLQPVVDSSKQRSRQEWMRRQQTSILNSFDPQQLAGSGDQTDSDSSGGVFVGPLVPIWADPPASSAETPATLLFVRRVRIEGETVLQGFLCDWPRLAATLCAQVSDLLPGVALAALDRTDTNSDGIVDTGETRLATVPARLVVGPVVTPVIATLTPTRGTLLAGWIAIAIAFGAVAVTIRAIMRDAERRGRFASAVTHELRTPLTTFRMYSEMLAEGMVPDEAQRRVYLETLRSEANRLARLVENVLAYTRLERGRVVREPETTTVGLLADRMRPELERLAAGTGMRLDLRMDAPRETPIDIDVDVVRQILVNLVENATKYAATAVDTTIHLDLAVVDGRLDIGVRDHGPGIPASRARSVFAAFDRGDADEAAGIGLGLAIARGLARSQGGDLQLCPSNGSAHEGATGATFRLSLPA